MLLLLSANLNTALIALLVGMITVFIVLSLVVLTGRVLIFLTNRYFPVEQKKSAFTPVTKRQVQEETTAMPPAQLAAIIAVVEIATKGNGRVVKIEKI